MRELTEKEYFIEACLSDDLQDFYQNWIKEKPNRIQFFYNINGYLLHKYWFPNNKCSETNQQLNKENIDIRIGYWSPFGWKPVYKEIKQETMKNEAYNCQLIDKNCNDCMFLNRNNKQCTKLNKTVKLNPNICQPENDECFKHRKQHV